MNRALSAKEYNYFSYTYNKKKKIKNLILSYMGLTTKDSFLNWNSLDEKLLTLFYS